MALKSVIDEPFVQSWKTTESPMKISALPLRLQGDRIAGERLRDVREPVAASATPTTPRHRSCGGGLSDRHFRAGRAKLESLPPTYHNAKPTERENDN